MQSTGHQAVEEPNCKQVMLTLQVEPFCLDHLTISAGSNNNYYYYLSEQTQKLLCDI